MDVLLISENYLKNMTNVSDNINGKLMLPAIRNAQEIELRGILGDKLLDKILSLVSTDDIDLEANAAYKNLIYKAQPFLAYSALSDIIILTSVKIDNAGNEQVSDDRMEPISINDSFKLQSYYSNKADYYCKILQNYILQNRSSYPELSQCDVNDIKSNLFSSASCGIWLGGSRGRGKRRNCYGDRG